MVTDDEWMEWLMKQPLWRKRIPWGAPQWLKQHLLSRFKIKEEVLPLLDKWDIWEEQIIESLSKEELTGQEIIDRLDIKLETFEDKFKFINFIESIADKITYTVY